MKYLKLNDKIDILNFSIRTNNCLKNSNINTIEDLLSYPEEHFSLIRNMGNKSLKEVTDFLNSIVTFNNGLVIVDTNENNNVVKTFIGQDGNTYYDIEINYDILPIRAANALIRSGYQYISEIMYFTYDEIYRIRNMGRVSAESVYNYIINLQLVKVTDKVELSEEDIKLKNIIKDIAQCFNMSFLEVSEIMDDCLRRYPNIETNQLIHKIYSNDKLNAKAKEFIITNIRLKREMHHEEVVSLLPQNIQNTLIPNELLSQLTNEKAIKINDGLITAVDISVIKYIASVYEGKKLEILMDRIHGLTLEEIGNKHNITRERVRQIISKEIRKFPRTYEDEYLYYVQNYDFSMENFMLAFGEPETTYYYLSLFRKKIRQPLEDALEDESISENVKRKIEHVVYKQYVLINGVRIKKRRPDLVKYYIRTYCTTLTHFDDFVSNYRIFLNQNNLDESLMIEERTYENHLQESNYVVWKLGKEFRYYNIENTDLDEMLEILNLKQYNNIEISTLKLFRENEKLMYKYDIRDEFELHNILKKVCKMKSIGNIRFGRMPMILFGNANRDEQILDLMIQHAPISMYDLADIGEEVFGYRNYTSLALYFNCIRDYLNNGIFRIDEKIMPNETLRKFKMILNEDYYTIEKIKQLFMVNFPNEEKSLINNHNLKLLGFRVYSSYVINEKYNNVWDYLDSLILSNDLVDLEGIDKETLGSNLYNYISYIRNERKVVEFERNKFISMRKLNELGVTIEDLIDYCNSVYKMVEKDTFFTVKSLRNKGFTHRLDELNYDYFFYESILIEDERFSSRRMKDIRLLYRGNKVIEFIDLISYILEKYRKFNLSELVDYLENEYGIITRKDKIEQFIKDSNMYYDQILDVIFIDFESSREITLVDFD